MLLVAAGAPARWPATVIRGRRGTLSCGLIRSRARAGWRRQRAPRVVVPGNTLMWFDSIAGTGGMAATAGPKSGRSRPAVSRGTRGCRSAWLLVPGRRAEAECSGTRRPKPNPTAVLSSPFRVNPWPLDSFGRGSGVGEIVRRKVDGGHNDCEAVQAALNSDAGVVLIPLGRCAIAPSRTPRPEPVRAVQLSSLWVRLPVVTPKREVISTKDQGSLSQW